MIKNKLEQENEDKDLWRKGLTFLLYFSIVSSDFGTNEQGAISLTLFS